jgi:hypothetical protein
MPRFVPARLFPKWSLLQQWYGDLFSREGLLAKPFQRGPVDIHTKDRNLASSSSSVRRMASERSGLPAASLRYAASDAICRSTTLSIATQEIMRHPLEGPARGPSCQSNPPATPTSRTQPNRCQMIDFLLDA